MNNGGVCRKVPWFARVCYKDLINCLDNFFYSSWNDLADFISFYTLSETVFHSGIGLGNETSPGLQSRMVLTDQESGVWCAHTKGI